MSAARTGVNVDATLLDFTSLFSHFYSDNSNSPLLDRNFIPLDKKFTEIPDNSYTGSCNSTRMPFISYYFCIICKTEQIKLALVNFI